MAKRTPQIFICYARKDNEDSDPNKRWLDRLQEHLASLELQGQVDIWSDKEIELGEEWHSKIQATLQQVKAAVLLISPAFLASEYIRNSELPVLLKNAKDKGVVILPILLRQCSWKETKFKYPDPQEGPEELSLSSIQVSSTRPLNALQDHEQDEILCRVTQRISQIVNTDKSDLAQNTIEPQKVQSQEYYINRPPVEKICFQEIEQEGALLRIKAPQKMGKSLLLKKIFEEVEPKNYGRVRIDLQLLESSILRDSSRFLRWLCQRVSRGLKLEDCLEDYWGEMTPNTSCTDYFEEYILENLETPLVLGIDNIDRIFAPEFQPIAADFFGLLRSWWGFAQTTGGNWTKLRLIVIYSTEDLPKLSIYQSPFNVGTEIKLPEFEDEQVQTLAFRYGLNWSLTQVRELKEQIGGHPYLVHEAIKNLKMNPKLTLTHLLEKAATDEGIYAHHLQHHWSTLEQEPTLVGQLKTIVEASEPIAITPTYLYKLDSMGLITKVGNQVQPRCQLYRQYFCERLLTLNAS